MTGANGLLAGAESVEAAANGTLIVFENGVDSILIQGLDISNFSDADFV